MHSCAVGHTISHQVHQNDRAMTPLPSRLLILDFGSQYSHLIVRRYRELGVYSELLRCDTALNVIQEFGASGIVLSGGPSSVYDVKAPHVPDGFWKYVEQTKIPVLGICYGMQEMQQALGGKVESSTHREFGYAEVQQVLNKENTTTELFSSIPKTIQVWMSHGDTVTTLAPGFEVIGTSPSSPYAVIVDRKRQLWGIQFHPEVTHTINGKQLLLNFVSKICGIQLGSWNMNTFASTEIQRLKERIGNRHVIGALSGGVDSTVAAALLHTAIGERFHGFMIDTGVLRKNEGPEVIERLRR